KLSKGQRKRRNRAARAAAASKGLASTQPSPLKPSAFLTLHGDIISQIVPELAPLDVIHLAQVNKSSCGAKEGRKPDMYLRVRLCPPCRKRMLINWKTIEPEEVRYLVLTSDASCSRDQRYDQIYLSLKHEVTAVATRLSELESSGNEKDLQDWTKIRKEEVKRQTEHAELVTQFLVDSRRTRNRELRMNWRTQVESRLLEMGCLKHEKDFPREKQDEWKGFVRRAQVLTEEKWDRLKPTILSFIETGVQERAQQEQKLRRSNRCRRLYSLFRSLQEKIGTLPPSLDGLSTAAVTALLVKWLPSPDFEDTLDWPIMRNLVENDVPIEQMESQFEQHRDGIKQLITDWGKQVKREWAHILREGRRKDDLTVDPPRACLLVSKMEVDPFEDADSDTSLLFRADSIIAHYINAAKGWETVQPHLATFPALGITHRNIHGLEPNGLGPLIAQLSAQEIADADTKIKRLHRTTWVEQVAEELGLPTSTQEPALVGDDTSSRDSTSAGQSEVEAIEGDNGTEENEEDEGEEDGDEEDEETEGEEQDSEDEGEMVIWPHSRLACKLCEQAKLGAEMFVFMGISALFDHLRHV
ncbi:hypothetical protein FRC07_001522, partial [Ceratobasidium sp. 392]